MQESSNSRNDGHGLWSYDLLEQVCAPLGPPATSCSRCCGRSQRHWCSDCQRGSRPPTVWRLTRPATPLEPSNMLSDRRPIVAGASWAGEPAETGRGRRHAGEEAGCGPNCSCHLPTPWRLRLRHAAPRSPCAPLSRQLQKLAEPRRAGVAGAVTQHGAPSMAAWTSGREANLASPHRRTGPFSPSSPDAAISS